MPLLRFLDLLSIWLNRILLVIAGVVLVTMMTMACANMVGRGLLELPLKGTYELMGFFGAVLTAFALGSTQEKKGHIALTVLSGVFPKGVERFIDVISALVCATFFGLVAWQTTLWSMMLLDMGDLSETLQIVYAPFPMAVAFGCAVLSLSIFTDFLRGILGKEQLS